MKTFAESSLEVFAEQRAVAPTPKLEVIGERNIVVGCCAVAEESGQSVMDALSSYKQILDDHDIEPTGAVDTGNWRDATRIIATNLQSPNTDTLHVLSTVLMHKNPYRDIAKFSHPSMGRARLFD